MDRRDDHVLMDGVRSPGGDEHAAPGEAGLSDVEVLLQDVALSMAFQVTPYNPQYVIKRLLPNDCYKIISGMPSYSERHGIGEVGPLHTPVPKKALLHAIDRNEIVTIDDAPHDDAVNCYMSSHIQNSASNSTPAMPDHTPSQLLPGLMVNASLRRPKVRPPK